MKKNNIQIRFYEKKDNEVKVEVECYSSKFVSFISKCMVLFSAEILGITTIEKQLFQVVFKVTQPVSKELFEKVIKLM